MRNEGLPEDDRNEAATLYMDGWSLARVAERFGCSVGSVRKEF
jgi:DNA-directed RNA polymerase specialized sigma24 family protein